jgi:hypothetical protein
MFQRYIGGIYTRNIPPSWMWNGSGISRDNLCERSPRTAIPNSLVWLLVFCVVSTKLVITLYWEVQWACSFLALESWLQDGSIKYSWNSRAIGNKELWSILYAGSKLVQSGGSKWNFLDHYFELVILGFQAGPIGRPNGILLNPWFELVILGLTASCCSLNHHI